MKMLAIETSCDETAAAVVEDGTKILSNVIASSRDMHEKWGGIVPEIAARKQLEYIIPVVVESLSPFIKSGGKIKNKKQAQLFDYKEIIEKNIDAIAVTIGPGLIGSLLIGVEVAKIIAWVCSKPIIPVNHVLAHMYANFTTERDEIKSKVTNNINSNQTIQQSKNVLADAQNQIITFPAISLVVSGGHTELYLMDSPKKLQWLGGTIDDAAGECFDKTARLIGLGAGGGLAIQSAANKFIVSNLKLKINLPRPMINDNSLNFSFSGLKTAVLREWNKQSNNQELVTAFAHEIQESITDVLVTKTLKTAEQYSAKSILLSGGVSSNLRLRDKFNSELKTKNYNLFVPPVSLCTDNAVYIAACAYFRGKPVKWQKIDAKPDLSVEVNK